MDPVKDTTPVGSEASRQAQPEPASAASSPAAVEAQVVDDFDATAFIRDWSREGERPVANPAPQLEPLDAVYAKRGSQPFVLVASQRHYSGEADDPRFYVDIANLEEVGLDDTSGQFWASYDEAVAFALPLAAMLHLDIEYVL